MRYESKYEKYYGIDPFNPVNTLKQHGILGMKWGVWNEETKARYLGTRRRKKSKADEPLRSKIGSKNKNDLKMMTDEEKRKNADSKYFNRFTKKVNDKALLQDINSDEDFNKKMNPNQQKILKELVEDNNYGAFLYGEINRTANQLMVRSFYDTRDKNKKITDVLTKDSFKKFLDANYRNVFQPKEADAIWKHVNELAKYSDACDKIFDDEIKKMGFSDSKKAAIKDVLYKYYVEPIWLLRIEFQPKSNIGAKNDLISKIKGLFPNFNAADEQPHLKRTHLSKELANISDEELNSAIKRMQLEQTYLNMLKNYPNSSDKGKKYVDQFSDELFKNLSNGLGGAMGKRIAKAIDDLVNGDSNNDKKYDNEVRSKSNDEIKAYNERKKLEEAYKGYRQKEDKK